MPTSLWRLVQAVAAGDCWAKRAANKGVARRRLKALRPGLSAVVVPAWHRGTSYWAHPVTSFKTEEVLDDNLQTVCGELRDVGVEFVVLPPQTHRRRVVVVAEQDRRAVLTGLADGLRSEAVYGCLLSEGGVGSPHPFGAAALRAGDAAGIRVFRFLADARGKFLSGPRLGCDIQFWRTPPEHIEEHYEPLAPGTLTAPRLGNAWTDVLPAELQTESWASQPDAVPPSSAPVSYPHVFEVQFPIDVVYTWVDGSDPGWLERKNSTLSGTEELLSHPLSGNQSRFLSRDELRYSLRSLEMHADWVRRIFLVTDRQVPPWLQTEHPRLTIVDHTELFADRGRLPTFNSHAIESQLHHIDGLSEHFLYLNDDVFFGAAVTPELFFNANGMSKFFCSNAKIGLGEPHTSDEPVVSAGKNNRTLLEESFAVSITNRLQHAPHALRRSVLAEIEQRFSEAVNQTAHTQFRSPSDISMCASLAHYYGYLTGRATPGKLRYFYADIARRETSVRLDQLVRNRDVDTFCLNDVKFQEQEALRLQTMVFEFLDSYFPLPSSFEKAGT